MRTNGLLFFLIILFIVCTGQAQIFHIPLDSLTTLDDAGLHVEAFTPTPAKPVKLPPGKVGGEQFLKVFYSRDVSKDPDIVIMVRTTASGDLLYIDKNADNDLTDDGPPKFFPLNQDTLTFNLVSRTEAVPKQLERSC